MALEAIKACEKEGALPKAIIVVHLYGMPAKMKEIMAMPNVTVFLLLKMRLKPWFVYDGQACGSFGDFGVLSFNGNKIIHLGGRSLAFQQYKTLEKHVSCHPSQDKAPHYQHSEMGHNYRMSNIAAAIGVGQLKALNERVAARRANHEFYMDLLDAVPGISFLPEPKGYSSNRWLSCVLIDEQKAGRTVEEVRLHLEQDNIESRPLETCTTTAF